MTREKQIQNSTSSNRTNGFLGKILILLERLETEYRTLFVARRDIPFKIYTSDFDDAIIPPKSTTTETELDLVSHTPNNSY